MLDEADAVHGLEALGAVAAPEVVVDMEALSMVRHLRHGLVGVVLERLNGTEVIYIRTSWDVFLRKFLLYH